jgi:hypothetical protein
MNASGEHQSTSQQEKPVREEGEEVTSPLKQPKKRGGREKEVAGTNARANCSLFQARKETFARVPRKRKLKTSSPTTSQASDLNLPAEDTLAVVPTRLVSLTVSQLHGSGEAPSSSPAALDELTKK